MPALRSLAPSPLRGGAGLVLAFAALPFVAACAQIYDLLPFKMGTQATVAAITAPRTEAQPPAIDELARATPPNRSPPNRSPNGSIDDNPARLMGLAPAQLTGILGQPTFVRRDGGGEIWQYRDASCILHLFLYRDDATARVEHVELSQAEDGTALATPAAQRGCFGDLLARNGAV